MKYHMLNISESHVTNIPLIYTCYGLGSCVGVFIIDRITKLAGGAHIGLPAKANGNIDFLSADAILERLLYGFQRLGSNLMALRAKIIGGAQVLAYSAGTGSENIRSVQSFLVTNRILITAEDVGGIIARTGRFNSNTGELFISTSEGKRYTI